jgi:hypothetical protein
MTTAGTDVHPIESRVSRVEATIDTVQEAVERVEKESREGLALLDRKLDRQTELIIGKLERMGNTQAERGRTNWGVVTSAASLCVALVAAVGAALVNPIRVLDQEHSRRLDAIEERADKQQDMLLKTFEMAVRSDERGKRQGTGQ